MGRAEPAEDEGGSVSAAHCRAQLERILDSNDFDATERAHRFLRYVVDETLSGRGDRIKAYSIAVEVFGRDTSFDPQSDPIVRVEAGHLRRAIERYYLTAGAADPVLIAIPKGGYVPFFSRRPRHLPPAEPPAPAVSAQVEAAPSQGKTRPFLALAAVALLVAMLAAGAFAWWWTTSATGPGSPERPRLLVQPFEDLTGTEASATIARGLSQEVVGQLSKFKDIVVVESVDTRPGETIPSPRFALAGSVSLSDDAFRLRVKFTNWNDGSVLWANSYDGAMKVGELVGVQSDIARNVATTLAQSHGVIANADASRRMDNPPDDWAAYSCTLSFYAYRAESDVNRLPGVRECLEEAVARFPNYATAWGLLSQIYIDGMRFSYPFDPRTSPKTIDMALAAAKRAVELDPFNVRGLEAEMTALYFAKDIEGALAVGKQAMEINPNDTDLMKEYASWLAQSGNWAEGCRLSTEAVERNPARMAYSEAALALCAYFTGNYHEAATRIKRSPAVNNPTYHAMAAAFFAEGGYMEDAARERVWLEANAPGLIKNARQEVAMRLLRKQDVDFFLGSLKKAGLDIEN